MGVARLGPLMVLVVASCATRFYWTGAVTADSAIIVAGGYESQNLQVMTESTELLVWEQVVGQEVDKMAVHGLTPLTWYSYSFGGNAAGRFRTFPAVNTDHDVLIAFGGCARADSEAFTAIDKLHPDLFIHLGDIHYRDIAVNDESLFSEAYAETLGAEHFNGLLRDTPVAYIWDDHDYGSNNAGIDSTSRSAAMRSYRRNVPHYPLGASTQLTDPLAPLPVYQAFSLGRIRVVMLDLRSEMGSTIMSAKQMQWFQAELVQAPQYAVLVIVSSLPWVGTVDLGTDTWYGFPAEREQVSNTIASHNLTNVMLLAADAHMLAFDDGTNTDYSTVPGAAGMPVMQAGPLMNLGSAKGGPFTHGCFATYCGLNKQFGTLRLTTDEEGVATATWTGYSLQSGGLEPDSLFEHVATVPFVRDGQLSTPRGSCSITFASPETIFALVLGPLAALALLLLPFWLRWKLWRNALVWSSIVLVPLLLFLGAAAGQLRVQVMYLDRYVLASALLYTFVAVALFSVELIRRWRRHRQREPSPSMLNLNTHCRLSQVSQEQSQSSEPAAGTSLGTALELEQVVAAAPNTR